MSNPCTTNCGRIWLRRDFADEILLFGDYLLTQPYGQHYGPLRERKNRLLGLSPALPQYLIYDVDAGNLRITMDDGGCHATSINCQIEEMLALVERSVGWTKETGSAHPLQCGRGGGARRVFLHCCHSGRGWVLPLSPALTQFVATSQ